MNRRTFLRFAAANVGLAALGARQDTPSRSPDVIVVGAGAFGGWTALSLREMGFSVILVDAYGPGNSRASSGGETRQIRVGYGEREIYSRWVLKAFERWKAREDEWGIKLLLPTGRLLLASEWTDSLKATERVLDKLGVETEVIRHDELARRYPQMRPEGIEFALFEPSAAVLMARAGCRAVAEALVRKGGHLAIARAEPGRRSRNRLESVTLSTGETLTASQYVFACGPWLPKVFPDVMEKKLFVPRRDVFYFGTPSGDDRFTYPNFPNFSEKGYYGFSSIDHRGFQVCPVGERTPFDPDADERVASPYQVKRARDYLAHRFPALKDQPIIESRVCQLEMSVDEHFIIDPHPSMENVWIVGGGSGHGYKHGPVIGEYVAQRVMGHDTAPELESVFRLKEETFG